MSRMYNLCYNPILSCVSPFRTDQKFAGQSSLYLVLASTAPDNPVRRKYCAMQPAAIMSFIFLCREVIEPIAANSLECMVLGAKTCFKVAHGMTIEEALQRDKTKLPEEFQEATYCSEFDMRCAAAARTWNRPHAIDNLSYVLADLMPALSIVRLFAFVSTLQPNL